MANLFKRAAIFTDLHWGLKSNSIQHNTDCAQFIDWFIESAKKENCETCFFLGDWHHNRASINIQTLQFSLNALESLSRAFDVVYFLVGNHDLYYRDRRDVHGVEWAKHLPNVRIINDWFTADDVIIAPWLVGDDWLKLQHRGGKYLFGHFELPHFYMNSLVAMPDHGDLNIDHLKNFDSVYSGHFHKRQTRGNVTYIGNAFPHNYSDAGDDSRGMTIIEWGESPHFKIWPNQPRFRVYKLSEVLDNPQELLKPRMNIKVNLDIDINFEEANYIKEQLMPQYNLREMSLIAQQSDIESDQTDYSTLQFESVDTIVQNQIDQLSDGAYNRRLLLSIYHSL